MGVRRRRRAPTGSAGYPEIDARTVQRPLAARYATPLSTPLGCVLLDLEDRLDDDGQAGAQRGSPSTDLA